MYKLPITTTVISEAKLYAMESIKHTVDYKGWGDCHQKLCRITIGNFCQLWLAEFCKINGIPHVKDNSSPYEPDKCDLTINGHAIDCKSSVVSSLPMQVSPHCEKQENIDFYAFFSTDKEMNFIEPLGFISRLKFMKEAMVVNVGDTIPGTNLVQRFDKSYFINKENLYGFFNGVDYFVNTPKRQKEAA